MIIGRMPSAEMDMTLMAIIKAISVGTLRQNSGIMLVFLLVHYIHKQVQMDMLQNVGRLVVILMLNIMELFILI